jgi:trk system potassium uptake protein TrkH
VLTITALLLAAGTVVFLTLEHNNPETMGPLPWPVKVLASYFQAATPRTAGFNTINIGGMTTAGLFFTIILMFIGASPASTGGGVKTTTFGVLLLTVLSVVRNREDVDAFQKRVSEEVIYKALAITLISLALVVTVTMLLSFTEVHHASFLQVLFETVSAFGTVGLSTGITPELTVIGRLLIILTMYSGRVGPLSLFIALTQQQHPSSFHYPEDKIMVG